ncbi:MAG: hypothetical protein Q9195_009024 [Heterodermia aff. obscurata]
MSLNRRACRLFPTRLQPGGLKYAGISNDTLIPALRSFLLTRSCRRHVGLAPGPLEARKRATRRRLMGLAPSGGALPAGEIASQIGFESWMFGRSRANPQTYQWQEPSDPSRQQLKEKEKVALPSWLTGADSTQKQTPKMHSENARPSNSKVLEGAATEYRGELQDPQNPALSDLEHCKSLEDIRTFLEREVRRRPRRRPKLSALAFQCLLEKDTPTETLLEFLEDPDLNALKANNIRQLLTHWTQRESLKTGKDEMLVDWIQAQVILGFLPFQDISSLLKSINSPNNSGLTTVNRELFYTKLIEGVRRCTVCGSMSVKENMLYTIFLFISSGQMSPAMVSLGWGIARTSSRANHGLMNDKIGSFVSNCMLSQSSTAVITNVEDSIAIALENIRSFPDHVAEAFIQSASKALIMKIDESNPTISGRKTERNSERKRSLEQLDKWWMSLHDCGLLCKIQELPSWQIVEHALGSQANDVVASYLRLMDDRSRCLFFIRHCFQSELERKGWAESGRYDNIRAHIEAQFKDICEEHPGRSPFVNLLISIRLMSARRDPIIRNLFDIISTLDISGTSLVLVEARSTARVRVDTRFVIQEIEYYLERNEIGIAYRVFQSFPFVPLEYVPALAEAMIANPNLCTNTAFHYRDRRQKWIDKVPPTHIRPRSITQLRTQLLNGMAYASARSPHAPSISFQQVYKCYRVLKGDGLPITAKLTKALTYAGIARYLMCGQWVPTVRYNMIWALVREVEGQQAADRLDDLVYSWRGRILDQKMYRKLKERALGLPRGSL